MRIALVTETYPPEINGVAMTTGRFVDALAARGHNLHICRPRQGRDDKPRQDERIEEALFTGFPIPRYPELRMGLPARARFESLWREWRPDVVQIITEGPLGGSALRAARRLGIPVGTDFHTHFPMYSRHYGIGWMRPVLETYLRWLHNASLCTLVPTRELRDELKSDGYRNLAIVARGVDTELFDPRRRSQALRAEWGATDATLVVLYVGRIAREKNIEVVFDTFAAMRREVADAKLVLVGDGPIRAGLAEKYPGVVFSGTRRGEELGAHYASGDIFLFPSLSETYGNVTVEAMASGLAVVAYDYAAAREHIRHAVNGLTVPVDDAASFTKLACALALDRERATEIGRQARVSAQRVSWDHVTDRFETILRKMASGLPIDEPTTALPARAV
ncbi:MAG: glycosyltransferase family 1 protein [Proteobacteria bacterium]|nr:glycosyltransferase family 1 protein [Burkholderiales bacterium]